jgi:hypothetical protein
MEGWKEYIDVLVQAPVAVTMIFVIYKTFTMFKQIISDYQKIIEKLIDKR